MVYQSTLMVLVIACVLIVQLRFVTVAEVIHQGSLPGSSKNSFFLKNRLFFSPKIVRVYAKFVQICGKFLKYFYSEELIQVKIVAKVRITQQVVVKLSKGKPETAFQGLVFHKHTQLRVKAETKKKTILFCTTSWRELHYLCVSDPYHFTN